LLDDLKVIVMADEKKWTRGGREQIPDNPQYQGMLTHVNQS